MAQFTRVNNIQSDRGRIRIFQKQLRNVPYPSAEAMQAVVAQLAETNAKARKVDARAYVSDR